MARACLVTFSRSLSAPVVMRPKITSSAARPPMVAHISSSIWSLEVNWRSSGRYHAAPSERPRGTIVTLTNGEACSSSQLTVACPDSWYAITSFSSGVMNLDFFSSPPTMRSTASKKSCFSMTFLFLRAATRAASLHTLAMSAPLKPGVWRARNSTSTSSPSLSGRR